MKTIILSIILVSLFQFHALSQNRICGWDTEKITSIEVEFTSPNNEKDVNVFNDSRDLDAIISFLKNVNFRDLNSSNMDSLKLNDEREYKISFKGQRDQVYLLKHSACIGKTSFLINKDVIRDFDSLIQELADN